ncbi:MAG: AAA family ATPase, partial [Candidatus Latescibacterota bacterium]
QVMLHQDSGSRGRPVNPGKSPRTILGGTNTKEYPTVLAARREMSSWHSLHLEPSSLRAPDPFGAETHVSERGAHVAATLRRLAGSPDNGQVLAEAANRLAELVPDVEELHVDEDMARQQLTVQARMKGIQQWLGPRALSDGTLRFLALVTMQMDAEGGRLLCMEEPENGIHPESIPALVRLLRDYAADPEIAVGDDNPVRQVVVNTHSPDILKQLELSEVVFVESVNGPDGSAAVVAGVRGGWREMEHQVTLERLREVLGGAPYDAKLEEALQLRLPLPGTER